MSNHVETELRRQLSNAYPLEETPPEFRRHIEQVTRTAFSARPIAPRNITPPRRHVFISAAAAISVIGAATTIGLTFKSSTEPPSNAAGPATSQSALKATKTSNEDASSATAPIPTSNWVPGEPSDAGLGQGLLSTGPDGCIRLDGSVVIWPKGYYSGIDGDGTITVYGPDGIARAKDGMRISASGGWSDSDPAGCTSKSPYRPFYLQDELPQLP